MMDTFLLGLIGFVAMVLLQLAADGFNISYLGTIGLVTALYVTLASITDTYPFFELRSGRTRIIRKLRALGATFIALLVFFFSIQTTSEYSRLWIGVWFVAAALVITVVDFVFDVLFDQAARRGWCIERVAIIGAGGLVPSVLEYAALEENSLRRIVAVHVADDRGAVDALLSEGPLDVDHIILAYDSQRDPVPKYLAARLAMRPVRLSSFADFYDTGHRALEVRQFGGVMCLALTDRPISGWDGIAKRIEDILIAGLALVLLSPLMIVIALAVKLESAGPVLFRQRRVGFDNGVFMMLKFRSMYTHLSDAGAARQTGRGDPRVTRVGRFIRRTSLDELPQLLNVLKGDMSIVGPRPHALATQAGGHNLEDVVAEYAARHRVKPGLTGWAQVNGYRGELDTIEKLRKRVEYDLYYIENWSLWLDIKVMVMTALTVLRDRNAY